jgi:hypothetical protein
MVRLEESGPGATWTTPVDHLLASGGRGGERGHSVRARDGRRESPEPDGPGLVPHRPEGDEHDGMDGIGEVPMPRPSSRSIV